jgi:hypoxanthine phosphoribosyltransferase
MSKTPLSFLQISRRLRACQLPEVDLVIGIATGGTVPASLAAYQLGCDLLMAHVNYRDEQNKPRYDDPLLLRMPDLPTSTGLRVLLVDDVSVTGKTLNRVKALLKGYTVYTLVMKGKGDFVLFPEVGTCVQWPWKDN